ncbi:MAG: class I SAM-dependent methyltransferase [Nitrosopumilaceae archaeon]
MVLRRMDDHFSEIAELYSKLRITDEEPILKIKEVLDSTNIMGADVGCGDGRYDLKLFHHLSDFIDLCCIDCNEKMLKTLEDHLIQKNIKNFQIRKGFAENLPLEYNSMDCLFTFNALHHFDALRFLKSASYALKDNGYLFIYTRLKSQNDKNIWGRYFPHFNEKETRLFELEELKNIVKEISDLKIQSIDFFKYKRVFNLYELIYKARNHHYSTFDLYTKSELEEAVEEFKQKIQQNFANPERISWFDENIMLTLIKR